MHDLYVNVYRVGRTYGGPEEGGWFVDCGEPVTSILVDRDTVHRDTWLAAGADPDTYDMMVDYGPRVVDCGDYPGDFAADFAANLREAANRLAERLRQRFPDTGKRCSVLGGDDYDVRVQTHYGRAFPDSIPRWE